MTETLIKALQQARCYDHPVETIELMETHISWILLTGPYAYKLKKPLNLGFLDFTSLEARHHYCQEELRLNQRLAPELYCDVVAIRGTEHAPVITSTLPAHGAPTGAPIEFAVKMVQFDQAARLDHVLKRHDLTLEQIDQLAGTLATFHQQCPVATAQTPFGTPERLYQPIQECFDQLDSQLNAEELRRLDPVRSWCEQQFEQLKPLMIQRKRGGSIRECHGDVHLANMVLIAERITLFDCIEFSENLRWIDVMSEMAFLTMDLVDRGAAEFSHHLLNRYLEITGDYHGLPLLRFYQVYRALVRAKIAAIRCRQAQSTSEIAASARRDCLRYVELASTFTKPHRPRLWITHGLSGSGKTAFSKQLAAATGAIHLRSDIERKRLFGMEADTASTAAQKTQLYGAAMTDRVYKELAAIGEALVLAGYRVLVDATFLQRRQRALFIALARKRNVPLTILHLNAPLALLRERIRRRHAAGSDASEADAAVLAWQVQNLEPLDKQEQLSSIPVPSDQPVDAAGLAKKLL